jgi:hypothetical protein
MDSASATAKSLGVPQSIFLIKARHDSPAAPGVPVFFQAWAERVRRTDGRLRAENIQVPVVSGQEDGWRMEGRRVPDTTFEGHAHACRPPAWYECDASVEPATGLNSRPLALHQRLCTTPLGRMCLHPEVRWALAQDRLAAEAEPLLRIPDLLAGEDRLAGAWRTERPEAAGSAAAASLVGAARGTAEELPWRQRLRGAVLRRLDAAAVGREVYLPCPAYFGEPYLAFAITSEYSLKAGLVRSMRTWSSPEGEARSAAWRKSPAQIAAMEGRLFPVLGPDRPRREGASALPLWLALAPVRDFETRSPWPLFPRAAGFRDAPPGFVVRIRPETMRELGGSYRTLARAGLSPYLAQPFADYCETRRELLAAWSEDVAGLALAKWGAG